MSGTTSAVAVVAAVLVMLLVHPSQAAGTWKVIADSTGVLATHAILLPRSSNVLVWGRQKAVSAVHAHGPLHWEQGEVPAWPY
jgi:hypothetical protein